MGLTTVQQFTFCTFLTLLNIKAFGERQINSTSKQISYLAFLCSNIWPWKASTFFSSGGVGSSGIDRAQNRPCNTSTHKKYMVESKCKASGLCEQCTRAKSMRQNDPLLTKNKNSEPKHFLHVQLYSFFLKAEEP